ncbi:hypothetical protein [Geomesophilobacter sediminis]|uniref:Uncharacterized protein n=1 Tax=Geomesophilobacter sediminis TaxID=2798584 RepID=A0A8J7SAK8_9BACT|nr:hypothetical protein [Geomesophilobacter sediminis]MBJ6727540.1 hypothetical protein [Geomesophilobacter sediminis]
MKGKPCRTLILTLAATLTICALLAAGCALTHHTEALPKTNLPVLEDDLRKAQSQVEATQDAMQELSSAQEFDVAELFAEYVATAELMDRTRDQMNRHLEQLRVQGIDYFTEWAKDRGNYVNPKIRMLNQDQINDLSQPFAGITDEGDKVRRALTPFAFDVDQLRDSSPPTPRKIDYLDFLIKKGQNDAESLSDAIDLALVQVRLARAQLAQIVVPSAAEQRMQQSAPGGVSPAPPEEGAAPEQPVQEGPRRMDQPGLRRMEQR